MDELSAPRMMPVAGWYLDPEIPNTWRYWDGARWTEYRAPAGHLAAPDPHSFSNWFDQSLKAVGAVAWPVGAVVAATWVVAVIPVLAIASWLSRTTEGDEIGELLETDASGTIELTDDEVDRLFDLIGDLARMAAPWAIGAAVLAALLAAWTYALVVQATIDWRESQVRTRLGAAAGPALRRAPAVIASFVALTVLFVVLLAALFAPMLVVIVADGGGVAIALTAVFGALAATLVLVVVGVRVSLAPIAAVVGGHGVGIARSWMLTDGRFWAVFVRGLVASVIAGAIGGVLSFVVGFSLAFGVAAFVTVNVLVQAATNAINTIIVVPSQVILSGHLEERAEGRPPGR